MAPSSLSFEAISAWLRPSSASSKILRPPGLLLVRAVQVCTVFPFPVAERHRVEFMPGHAHPDALRDLARESPFEYQEFMIALNPQLYSCRGALAIPPGVVVVHHRDHAHAQRGQLVLDHADAEEVVAAEPG